jgi:hypothetical protein
MAITERLEAKGAFFSDTRYPTQDLTGTCPSSVNAFCPPHRIPIEKTVFVFGVK